MPRRRVILRSSSDEEEEEDAEARGNDSVELSDRPDDATLPSNSPVTSNREPNPNPREPATVSDDELIYLSEGDLTPSDPIRPPLRPETSLGMDDGDASRIAEFVSRMGLRLKREWWVSCIAELERSVPQFSRLDVAAKAKLCFEQALHSDMNVCGGGALPRDLTSMHLIELTGPFVLQVDEIANIGCPLKGRYESANPGLKRCLKLSMTDGVQRVFGLEYRPIKDLQVLAPAGFKIVISNVQVRHGLLMLVPEVLEVLGGMAEELEEARKHLVEEIKKPPRGKRTRTGTAPSLAARATHAAWSENGNDTNNHVNSSTSEATNQLHTHRQDFPSNATRTDIGLRNMEVPTTSMSMEAAVSRVEHMQIDHVSINEERNTSDLPSTSGSIHTIASTVGTVYSNNGENNSGHQSSFAEEMHIDNSSLRDTSRVDSGIIDMVDDVHNMLLLPRNMETPFTYLANLSAKWAAMKDTVPSVQGKIKCFLTGVKNFQYKRRTTYELLCYVDDGSLISEILIHHKFVEKGIGHSPIEVSAALSSSTPTIASTMKEKLRRFQTYLANFEGTMMMEMNKTCEYPVAIELNEGCSTSEARLLFQRLKSSTPRSSLIPSGADPIVLSP